MRESLILIGGRLGGSITLCQNLTKAHQSTNQWSFLIKSPNVKFSSKIAQEMQFFKNLNLNNLICVLKLNTLDFPSKMAQKDITTLVLQNQFFTQMHEALGFWEMIFMPDFSKMTQIYYFSYICISIYIYM